jgi:very-short-patch-repair endonuclease
VGGKSATNDADGAIALVAARQHGVVSADQLEGAGIRERGRARRVRAGRLHRIHRGVYAVGHRGLSPEGRWMAAVLALGPAAVLSHRSAGRLWGILRANGAAGATHVTVAGEAGRRSRPGIVVHRSRTLTPNQTTRCAGIPVTTPRRTLADLRRTLPRPRFEAARRQAEFLGLPVQPELEPDGTRSEFEARFLALARRHRLPEPEVNVRVGPNTVDFLWRGPGLIVELDGYRAHGTSSAFENDRARDVELRLLGYEVVRFTWRQLSDHPRDVVSAIRRLLTTLDASPRRSASRGGQIK